MPSFRSQLYQLARLIGDIDALFHPEKLARRFTNKLIGRSVVSKLYLRPRGPKEPK